MSILLRNATITDCNRALEGDLLIENGRIAAVGACPGSAERVIDARGLHILPSFVDLHAHFRDPGLTHKEDITSGCRAAVHGGYTYVNLMPNTKPVCSSAEVVDYVLGKAGEANLCGVHQTMSITRAFDGTTLSHWDQPHGSVRWLTDDGYGVEGTAIMLAAMRKAKERGLGVMLHEEEAALSATDMYLAEELMTFRDVQLAVLTGCKTHICHVSTINAMKTIIDGKKRCGNLTCEVSPHHLFLNDGAGGRVNPPLRGEEHRRYLIECVKDGLVDAIATDHAPHTPEEKAAGANGFTGLDLSFATCYTALVQPGHITLSDLSRLLSANPSRLMGLEGGRIAAGLPANLVLADLRKPFVAAASDIHSKSKNSPVLGRELTGTIMMTLWEGRPVYEKAD